eukprot:s1051_g1.t1
MAQGAPLDRMGNGASGLHASVLPWLSDRQREVFAPAVFLFLCIFPRHAQQQPRRGRLREDGEFEPGEFFGQAALQSDGVTGRHEMTMAVGNVRLPRDTFDHQRHKDLSECEICLVEYEEGDELIRLPCLHLFHVNCVVPWLQKQRSCPGQTQRPIGLSAYFTGARETMSRLLTRIKAAIGVGVEPATDGEELDGFPSRRKLTQALTELDKTHGVRDEVSEASRAVLDECNSFFVQQENIYADEDNTEKEFLAKLSLWLSQGRTTGCRAAFSRPGLTSLDQAFGSTLEAEEKHYQN